MPDDLDSFLLSRPPTAERPLLGLTVLVVEDSLYACEAMRLLCLRSGARIRRADSLRSAHRHLSVYRPMAVIVDLGLPDGSGATLIRELAEAVPRVPVILGISGDAGAEAKALDAGADGFLMKPVESLAAFQSAILEHLPRSRHPKAPRRIPDQMISPDPDALRDDLSHAAEVLERGAPDGPILAYMAQFLTGLARLAHDDHLRSTAERLGSRLREGAASGEDVARITSLVRERLDQANLQAARSLAGRGQPG